MLRALVLFVFLLVSWLLLSGHYTPLLITLGVVSVLFAVTMAVRVNANDDEGLPLYLMLRLPLYLVWLVGQILLSNWATIRLILNGRISPCLCRVPTKEMKTASLVLYANSITLTPGTVTIEVEGDGYNKNDAFLVHALTHDMADELRGGDMERRVRSLDATHAKTRTAHTTNLKPASPKPTHQVKKRIPPSFSQGDTP